MHYPYILSAALFLITVDQGMGLMTPLLRSASTTRLLQIRKPAATTTTATALGASSSSLEEMDREDLLEYLNSDALGLSFTDYHKRQRQLSYLKNCPVFIDVAPADCDRIATSMKEIPVAKGATLIQKGDIKGDSMYFVVDGQFDCFGDNSTLLTTYQKQGDYFGELALIFEGQARQATIVASESSTVYKLDKTAFRESMQDSEVFDTARQMLLKKYSSTRLWDVLPNIQINEILDLVKAKLQFQSNNPNNYVNSLFAFTMGASFTILASLWSGGGRDAQSGWPIFFDLSQSSSPNLVPGMLPVRLVSVFLTVTAILGHLSIPKDERPTLTFKQGLQRRWHKLGVGMMVLLWARGIVKSRAGESVVAFLPLQMAISIVLETTKGPASSGDDDEKAQQQPKSRFVAAIASCALLGYEALRVLLGPNV